MSKFTSLSPNSANPTDIINQRFRSPYHFITNVRLFPPCTYYVTVCGRPHCRVYLRDRRATNKFHHHTDSLQVYAAGASYSRHPTPPQDEVRSAWIGRFGLHQGRDAEMVSELCRITLNEI